jgi:ABC-type uncharacterized transport system auxiliary subunit
MKRRSLLRTGLLLPAAAMAGCFGGAGRAPHTWWELDAPGAPGVAQPDPKRATLSLVVEGVAAGSLYDGTSLIYSRGAGMRAPYLYSSWTERPAARLARLAQRRLRARGGFRDVTLAEAGVAPDLLLTLTLDQLDHELTGDAGRLVLALSATLVDWKARRPIAWRRFSAVEPAVTADAEGAVAAASRAATAVLEELSPWVESAAGGSLQTPEPPVTSQGTPDRASTRPAGASHRSGKRPASARKAGSSAAGREAGSGPVSGDPISRGRPAVAR